MDAKIELQVASDLPIDIASAVIRYAMSCVTTDDERKTCITELKEIARHIDYYVRCQEELCRVNDMHF